jgi:urate oxidase
VISWNRYGKARVRLVKVVRPPAAQQSTQPHGLVDLTIDIQLEGAFEPVYAGDNRQCIATDTMKNTVYAFARRHTFEHVETLASILADHFVVQDPVQRVRITVSEQPWVRLSVDGRAHPHAFAQGGSERWTVTVVRDQGGAVVTSGLADLVLLKTTDSAFAGFRRDQFTTLPETEDRILATSITASWKYRRGTTEYGIRERIRAALIEAFASHDSRSVQHTLAAMADAALNATDKIDEITLSLPNRHHVLADLKPFGLDNPNQIFVPTPEPYGLIEATMRRS